MNLLSTLSHTDYSLLHSDTNKILFFDQIVIGGSLLLLILVSSIIASFLLLLLLLLLLLKGLPAHRASAVPDQRRMRIEAKKNEVFNLASQPWRQAGWQACWLDASQPGSSSCKNLSRKL